MRVGRHEDWRAVEMVLGAGSAFYGLWLLLPFATFDVAGAYRFVDALGVPEWLWGLAFVATGVLRLGAAARRRHWLRQATALAAVVKWTAWWLFLMLGEPWAAMPTFLFTFAVASILDYAASPQCAVEDGKCNGLLEHKVVVLASRLAHRSPKETSKWTSDR